MTHELRPIDGRDLVSLEPKQAAQLLAEGWTRRDIRAKVKAGDLVRLRRGSYLAGHPGPTPEARHMVLVRAVAPRRIGSVVSHASAAVMHGLPVPATALKRVQLISQSNFTGSVTGDSYELRRRRELGEVDFIGDIPVTSLLQTVVDVCRVVSMPDAVAVVDAALRKGADRRALVELLETEPRRRGTPLARRAISFGNPKSESPGESWSRWTMHELELPTPVLQQQFDLGDRRSRSDFWWPEEKVVGEFDGATKYGRLLKPGQSVQDVVMAEKQREVAFRRMGIWVVRWTWTDLTRRKEFRTMILDGLDRRAA